jgi:hypothetical protein
MRKRILLGAWVLVCAVLFNPPLPAQTQSDEQDFQILYHEPLDLPQTVPTVSGNQAGPSLNLSFRAFDQVFNLVLQPNDELTAHLPEEQRQQLTAKLQLYRGTIAGITDSWVRLSRWNDTWSGVFWDGSELYLIDSSTELNPALQPKMRGSGSSGSIIYRLSDTTRKDHGDDVLLPETSP